jgi:hypothetical protein
MCVCVCVRACVRERERGGWGGESTTHVVVRSKVSSSGHFAAKFVRHVEPQEPLMSCLAHHL